MQLLQPAMGKYLPAEVREALLGFGTSCNDTAVLLGLADAVEGFVERRFENAGVQIPAGQPGEDITAATDDWRNRAIAAYARAATRYAVYASRVAEAVAAGEAPCISPLDRVVPSMLASKFDTLLPVIRVAIANSAAENTVDSVSLMLQQRDVLKMMVRHRLHGAALSIYDDLHVSGSADIADELPRRLHEYAAEMVHIIGLLRAANTISVDGI